MQRFEKRVTRRYRAARLLAICGLIAATGCSRSGVESAAATSTPSSAVNERPIHLLDLDGRPFDLRQSSKGPVHVAVFVRSDCPISNRLAPVVRKLCQDFQSQGVDFYLIYVDPHEKPDAIRAHLREYEYPCPGLRDPEHTFVAQTKATVTPEAVVFDGNWSIAYRGRINDQFEDFGKMREMATKNDLQEAIAATLAGKPVEEPVTKAIGCYIDDLK